ncbi:hypothetical protein, partial [Bacillus sp. AP50]|uniref:hypothetical protein n=1 Tax=Bacillus sp. AP50 TaxID=3122950 RepID=UPI003397F181
MRNTQQIVERKVVVAGQIEKLEAELATAKERETLTVGEDYTIKVGRKSEQAELNTYAEVQATLIAQAEQDGKIIYKFRYGEGFDETTVVGDANRVVWEDGDDKVRSTEVITNRIVKAQDELEALDTEYADAEARESVAAGDTVSVKLGRGETAREVPAAVLGVHTDATGKKTVAVVAEDAVV